MPEFNMPMEQEAQNVENLRNRKRSIFYTPMPLGKTQGVHHNKLFFSLFVPSKWPIFNRNDSVCLPGSVPASICSFYWKFHVHFCKVQMPDGSTKEGVPVLCPTKQNEHHVDVLKYGALFRDVRCRICEEAQAWWSKFDEEWSRTTYNGTPLGDRWGYDRDNFQNIVGTNPVLKARHEEAFHYGAQPRWMFMVLDLSKVFGERKLDSDETGVQIEPFMQGKQVFDGLKTLIDTGIRFFDENNPQIVVLTKDSTKGPRFAKYSISNLGPWQADQSFKAYISNEASLPQIVGGRPGEEDTHMLVLSYDEQRACLGLMGPPGSGSTLSQQATNFNYGQNATGLPAPVPMAVQPAPGMQPYMGQPAAVAGVQPYMGPPGAHANVQPFVAPPVGTPPGYAPVPMAMQAPAPVPMAPAPVPIAAPVASAPVPLAAPVAPMPTAAPTPPVPTAAPAPVPISAPVVAPTPPAPVQPATFQQGPAPAQAGPVPAQNPAPEVGGASPPKPRRRGQTNW